jgi:hypothetical protein
MKYDVERERLRVDMEWREASHIAVAIEHEYERSNVASILAKEVRNLLSVDCPLKVLITYFRSNHFHPMLRELAEKAVQETQMGWQVQL